MAGGVGTSINVIQLAIEIGAILFSAGGLYVMVKSNRRDVDELKKEMKEVRENWVSRSYLDGELKQVEGRIIERMDAQANVIVGKVLIAIGSERRFEPRD